MPGTYGNGKICVGEVDRIVAHRGEIVQPIGKDHPEITARFRETGGNVIGLYDEPTPAS